MLHNFVEWFFPEGESLCGKTGPKCLLNIQQYSHLLESLKEQEYDIQNAIKGAEQLEPSMWLGEMYNGTGTLENSQAFPYKVKHTLAIQTREPPPSESLHSHKNLSTNVYRGFIHNCEKLETTKMSLNCRMNKETMVYPHNGIPLSDKKGMNS